MRKKLPKISLSRETLRQLDAGSLDAVPGGATTGPCSANTLCDLCSNRNTCDNWTACAWLP
jgi:hypothetical protein